MNRLLFIFAAIFCLTVATFAQKGVDTQTQRIRQESNKTIQTPVDQTTTSKGRGFDFGRDKTKVRAQLANPYRLSSRRDVLVRTAIDVLKEKKLIVDESASKTGEGIIVTQPFVFAKGAVISQNELNRYAILPSSTDAVWRSGRYLLRIEVQSIDGIQNDVSVTAKVEGKSENGLQTEWTALESSGAAEDEFLVKLIEAVTGNNLDEQKPADAPKDN